MLKRFIENYAKRIEKNYLYIWFLSFLNLWVMNQYFVVHDYMEEELLMYAYLVNIFIVIIDVSLLLCFLLCVTFGRLRISTYMTFAISLVWSFINVFYGRFFFHYLTISAFGQAGGLTDGVVVRSMLAGFQWTDMYYLLSLLLFFLIMHRKRLMDIRLSWKKIISVGIIIPFISLAFVFLIYSSYHLLNSNTRGNTLLYKYRINELLVNPTRARNPYPNIVTYHAGIIRCLLSEIKEIMIPYVLPEKQRLQIEKEYKNLKCRHTDHEVNPKVKNVIFILLESFMSFTSDLEVEGKSITPFLDSLKHADDVYYNGKVRSNITIGESGDGQFIYMTGILPLRAKYTVGEAKNNTIPYALPRLLENHMNIKYTEIIIPSSLGVWQQERMNQVYDFKKCYSKKMVEGNHGEDLTDESVFRLAMNTSKISNQPFFSMILSISTHQPYREYVDPSFTINDNSLPQGYRIYLNACHFADMQIRKYLNHLKQEGIYDNSLIVIASDHHAHLDAMGMDGKISTDLPFYIINGNIDKSNTYDGPCNQLDIYTTILDVLHVMCDWRGLGYSLLCSDYHNSVSDSTYEMSEQIILGDYFTYRK